MVDYRPPIHPAIKEGSSDPEPTPPSYRRKNHCFAWSPIRRMMKQQGSSFIAKSAVDLLIEHLEKTAMALTKQARTFTMHANRKKSNKIPITCI